MMNTQRSQVSIFAIALLMASLVIGVWLGVPTCYAPAPPYNETDAKVFDPDDLPWNNETDIIIFPAPPLPPFFSDFDITPTEIMLGDDLVISFVIRNPNNQTFTWLSTNRIGDITQIIEIELEAYESKIIWYRIIPNVAREYDVWIDGQTGTFRVISTEIIITDPLEELDIKIDNLNTTLQNLTIDYNAEVEGLNSKIDALETTLKTYSDRLNEEIGYFDGRISSLKNTIVWACVGIFVIIIFSTYTIIKKGALGQGDG